MNFKYPTEEEIETDQDKENEAVLTTMSAMVSAMQDAAAGSPLDNSLLVYAAIELAFHYGDQDYVEEVFREVQFRRSMVPQ